MADCDTEDQNDYVSERQRVAERFAALGGGELIEHQIAKMPKLADLVTDKHRDMVKDLCAGGMSHDSIARVMGISKERLQALFDYELAVGFELAESNLSRSLYLSGVAGNQTAATNWLRYHKHSQWSDKKEMTDKGAAQAVEELDKLKETGKDLLTLMLQDMSKDATKFKRHESITQLKVLVLESGTKKATKPKQLKRPKED